VLVGIICFLAVFMLNLVSAEIILTQPKSVYNLGENLNLGVEVSEIKTGFLEINLNCEEKQKNLYNSILSDTQIDLDIPLTNTYINDLLGSCKISADYAGESAVTSEFVISDVIDITISLGDLNVEPGQEISVKGETSKLNGQEVSGFIEVILSGTDINILRNVEKGKFDFSFSLPENIEGKDYTLIIKVYEKLGEEVTNQGTINKVLSVAKQPTKIDIVIDKQSLVPGTDLTFRVILYDQSNYEIPGDIDLSIINPEEDVVFTKMLISGEQEIYEVGSNFTAGYWTIEASSLDVSAKRLFYVEEKEEAEFRMENQTLIITNVGNVPYQKAVQIVIGDELEIRQMDLDVGAESSFRLVAPDGMYEVRISDGTQSLEFGTVSLTGNIIGVMDIRKAAGPLGRYPIVWLFLIIVCGLFILLLVNKVVKKRFIGFRPFKSKKVIHDKGGEVVIPDEGDAEHTLVLKGNKEESAVLALDSKKLDKNLIGRISKKIRDKKGVVYNAGDYLMGVFAPSLTKTTENELKAVNAAQEIEKLLNANEIDFGLGINTGNIISKKETKGLKFTSLGNTLNLAKKMANASKSEILLSGASSTKAKNIIKTEKHQRGGLDAYKITKIIDRGKYKKFVDDFLRKQDQYKK